MKILTTRFGGHPTVGAVSEGLSSGLSDSSAHREGDLSLSLAASVTEDPGCVSRGSLFGVVERVLGGVKIGAMGEDLGAGGKSE